MVGCNALDDNKNKSVCRLWLNGSKLYISFLDENKKDIKTELANLDSLYQHAELLLNTAAQIDAKRAVVAV